MARAIREFGSGKPCTRRRWPSLAAALALLAGSGIDPEGGRMPPGMMARAHGKDSKPAPAFFSGTTDHLPEGTVVQVISDSEPDPSRPRRKVVVGIRGGPSRGLAAQMYRSDLRPGE